MHASFPRSLLLLVAAALGFSGCASSPEVFRIEPLRPVAELRQEALAATPPAPRGDERPSDLVELVTARSDDPPRHPLCHRHTTSSASRCTRRRAHSCSGRPREALVRAHRKLEAQGYGLLVHDGYRPWSVTKMFWDATPPDKHDFVADPARARRHNRGCAVDLTLYDRQTGKTGRDAECVRRDVTDALMPDYAGGTVAAARLRDLLRGPWRRKASPCTGGVVALRLPRLAVVRSAERHLREPRAD